MQEENKRKRHDSPSESDSLGKHKKQKTLDSSEKDASRETSFNDRTSPIKNVKILVCGDIKGRFHKLFTMVHTIDQSKSGPFHMLFCVGQFFANPDDPDDDTDTNEGLVIGDQYQTVAQGTMTLKHSLKGAADEESFKYLTGEKKILIPTFFIDGNSGNQHLLEQMLDEGGDIVENLTYLGRFGMKEILGLRICYLSGMMDPYAYKNDSIKTHQYYRDCDIKELEKRLEGTTGHVDMLLTCEWPEEITNFVKHEQLPKSNDNKNFRRVGSHAVKTISKQCAPRYHFCSREGVYWARTPYKTVISTESSVITRFIALAPISDSKEADKKYLFAGNVTPIQYMTNEQKQCAKIFTDCPFDINLEQIRNKKQHQKQYQNQKHTFQPIPECWFCLSSKHLEKHLLVSIEDEAYLALPKGGLVDDHVLIISVRHAPNYAVLPNEAKHMMDQYKESLRKYFASQGKDIIVFERNIFVNRVPQHMHLQVIPIPKSTHHSDLASRLLEEGKESLLVFKIYDKKCDYTKVIEDSGCINSQYLLFELPDGTKCIHTISNPRIAMNFGRKFCAKLLEMPERENWKECVLSKEVETKKTQQFRKSFAKYNQ